MKNWPISDDCLCRLVPCISVKVGTFVKWSFLVISNKSARICLNIFGDSVIQSLKSGKHEKWHRSHVEARKACGFIQSIPLSDLKHDQKRFIRIPSLNVPEMRRSRTF